jgi:hypothetical protein
MLLHELQDGTARKEVVTGEAEEMLSSDGVDGENRRLG